jgi:hypothetical protein
VECEPEFKAITKQLLADASIDTEPEVCNDVLCIFCLFVFLNVFFFFDIYIYICMMIDYGIIFADVGSLGLMYRLVC